MNVARASMVRHAPPPRIVSHVLNPVMRFLLRTPLARSIAPLALIEFRGRRTGRRRRVVVGWHVVEDVGMVLTPAPWRLNFSDGLLATVRWRGRAVDLVGTLQSDPQLVADVINRVLANGASPRSLALTIPPGHRLDNVDVLHTGRTVIRFHTAHGELNSL